MKVISTKQAIGLKIVEYRPQNCPHKVWSKLVENSSCSSTFNFVFGVFLAVTVTADFTLLGLKWADVNCSMNFQPISIKFYRGTSETHMQVSPDLWIDQMT